MSRTNRRSLPQRAIATAALLMLLGAPGAATAAQGPASAPLFATPSGIAAIGPWIVVTNQSSGTLTVLLATNGSLVGRVARGTVGVARPSSIVAETISGRRTVFVAGTAGRVSELTVASSGPALTAHRIGILRPMDCGSRVAG
jgi:hypothetical protein